MRETKGITLISLIITIIVMLILIAVTVNVLIESGIIGSAKNAADKTGTAYENEAILNEITIGGVKYDSLQDFEQKNCSHTYGEWVVVKEATYTEAGERYRTCTKCNLKQTEYPDILACENHTYGEWVTDTEPTCVAVGKKHQTCSTCGTVTEEEIAVDTENGHSYGSWAVTTVATCSAEGEKTRTCTRCRQAEKIAVAKVEHKFTGATCSVCGCELNANTIASSSQKLNYYRKYVTGITLNNGDTETQWRIFYADTSNIYLIAADCINVKSYISSDLVDYGDDDYKAYFEKTIALEAYNGGAEETAIFGEGTVGGTLLKTYLDYLNADGSLAKNNPNMQATAFMLDTEAWSGYTDSNQETKYVDYAIGGPTVEMIKDSENEASGSDKRLIKCQKDGYAFSYRDGFSGNHGNVTSNAEVLSKNPALKNISYWVASPAAWSYRALWMIGSPNHFSGAVGDLWAEPYACHALGFRPVVRLNRDVKLTLSDTNTFTVGY